MEMLDRRAGFNDESIWKNWTVIFAIFAPPNRFVSSLVAESRSDDAKKRENTLPRS